jgi:hypothetical protein
MDMGSMMGKYVGESEANLRKALRIAEAAAPCVLWIDEIEKAFSGVGGNNDIMTRMFGYFLSWMQEKKNAVYVFRHGDEPNQPQVDPDEENLPYLHRYGSNLIKLAEEADIEPVHQESYVPHHEGEGKVVFLQELAKYCCEQDENMAVVCESFEISPNEIMTISKDASIICEQADTSKIIIPLKSDIRREALSILRGI